MVGRGKDPEKDGASGTSQPAQLPTFEQGPGWLMSLGRLPALCGLWQFISVGHNKLCQLASAMKKLLDELWAFPHTPSRQGLLSQQM